jgi:hypothetical protein
MKRTGLVRIGAVVIAGALMGGCATTEQLNEVRAIAEQAQSAASAAQSTADSALAAAQAATASAEAADAKASEALAAANEANNCCQVNSEKIDRMFEKVMQK